MPGANQPLHGIQGLSAKLQEFTRRLTSLESWQRTMSIPSDPWIAPVLINSWANEGGAFETVGYFKDPLGFVHVKGVVTGGTSGSTAFVLPVGYRPGASTYYAAIGATTSSLVSGRVTVDISGNVSIGFLAGMTFIGIAVPPFLAEN